MWCTQQNKQRQHFRVILMISVSVLEHVSFIFVQIYTSALLCIVVIAHFPEHDGILDAQLIAFRIAVSPSGEIFYNQGD